MTIFQREFYASYGWDDFFESQLPAFLKNNVFIGRVINEERNLYRVQFDRDHFVWAKVAGKMQYEALSRSDFPAVGDWVCLEISPGSESGVIQSILERKNTLQRKKVGEVSEIQILATNVDYVLIATSINNDLSFGRLERYLTFAWESKARPVILLTKSDLAENIDEVIRSVEERCPGVSVYALSKDSFHEAGFLKAFMSKGSTSVIVGSSGVGKSTLVNHLIGKEIIATQETRSDDDKGRHTTTSRALYESVFGGLIIDTPGMRELQFSDHQEGLSQQFGDIEALIESCGFNNCHHQTEKNCAILEALENGSLDKARWKSFLKISREVGHEMRKQNKWMMAEQRKVWKKRSIESRQKYKGWQ